VLFEQKHELPFSQDTLNNSRAIALSCTSVQILKTLGLWAGLGEQSTPLVSVHVSEHQSWGRIQFESKDYGLPALASVVPGEYLLSHLQAGLKASLDIDYQRPVMIDSFLAQDFGWQLQVGDRIFQASLLVACDGSESYIRKMLNIPVKRHDYQEMALSCNIDLAKPHHNIAYERFTHMGTVAILPFGEQRVKCIWSMPKANADIFSQCNETDFLKTVQELFGQRLGKFKSITTRMLHPLQQIQAQTLFSKRAVLLGNAANTLHPIAAQGFNLGLRDVAVIAELLVTAKKQAEDVGAEALLKRYALLRTQDHQTAQKTTHSLCHLSGPQSLGLKLSKSLGRFCLDVLPPVKKYLAKSFMGQRAWLPKLARGLKLDA